MLIPKKKILQYALIIIALFFIIQHLVSHKDELSLLMNARPDHIASVFAVTFLSYLSYSVSIFFVLRKLGLQSLTFWEWFKIVVVSRFINFHITQGANIYRTVKLKKMCDFPYTKSISMISFLGWFYTLTTLLFCFSVILVVDTKMTINNLNIPIVLALSIAVVYILPFAFKEISGHTKSHHKKIAWLEVKLTAVLTSIHEIAHDYHFLAKITIVSVLHFLLYLAIVHLSFQAIRVDIQFEQLSLFVTVLMLSKYFNIVPNNIGLTELLFGYLSESFGGLISSGIIVSGLIRIIDYILIAVLGVVFSRTFHPKSMDNTVTQEIT